MAEIRCKDTPKVPSLKEFRPKMGLPKLNGYKKPPPANYWNHWPKRTFEQTLPTKSWVSGSKLKELAMQYNYTDWSRLERVVERLNNNARIGCHGRGRLPTFSGKAKSAFEFGD